METEEGKRCGEICPYGAIDLSMKEEVFSIRAGAIVWAAGWEPYDASRIKYYGFGEYKNLITNVMMERLSSPNGPTRGKILRPSDKREAKSVAFVQCAGSRDENHLPYCSGVCCLASLKQAIYVREKNPDCEVTIFYIDIRVLDRYEDFYNRVKEDKKIRFIRSKIAEITEEKETGNLILEGEDTCKGEQISMRFDMVVLATGMVPNTIQIEAPDVPKDQFGFILRENGIKGIYAAGCVRRPADVATSVQDATAAAIKAIQSIRRG